MSELREECYKCLSNQKCNSAADYGSIYCMVTRKFKMPTFTANSIDKNKIIKYIYCNDVGEKIAVLNENELKAALRVDKIVFKEE